MTSTRIYLSAFGVHTGGGLVLLREFAQAAAGHIAVAVVDARLGDADKALFKAADIRLVPRRVTSRVAASIHLARDAGPNDVLFAFNSLPPLRRSAARTVVYVHASYLAGLNRGIKYSLGSHLRQKVERNLFGLARMNADEFWVQTDAMSRALRSQAPVPPVRIMPFVPSALQQRLQAVRDLAVPGPAVIRRYLYPADAVGHKNHAALIAAWRILADEGFAPRLELTLLDREFATVMSEGRAPPVELANIVNIGSRPHADILDRFRNGASLIFPSLTESFGLPMLEAQAAGAGVLTAEREYARDACTPDETFDPQSPRSIADAVRRHIGQPRTPTLPFDAAHIVRELLR